MTENELIRQLQHHIDQPEVFDPPPRNWRLLCRESIEAIQRLRGNKPHESETNARQEKLETALRGLYWDNVDYLTLNHLGGMDNHWMKAAREALGIRGELKAFVQLCAPHGKDWLTCPECAKAAVNGNSR